jgi:hypothetical protein
LQKRVTKARKASGKGEYNWIKYVRCHHHTRYEATMCPAHIWHLNQAILSILKSIPIARATHTGKRRSNKKSIRWMFCLRAWVNDASHYLWGVRLSTGKTFASLKVWAEYRKHEFFLHSIISILMVKFVINCMLNIQTQHKLLFNVKLIYSIQILGPWRWGNKPFFFFSGGAEEGAQWGKCPPVHGLKKCLGCECLHLLRSMIKIEINCRNELLRVGSREEWKRAAYGAWLPTVISRQLSGFYFDFHNNSTLTLQIYKKVAKCFFPFLPFQIYCIFCSQQ